MAEDTSAGDGAQSREDDQEACGDEDATEAADDSTTAVSGTAVEGGSNSMSVQD